MNMRSLTVVFGALTALALAACNVTTTTGGSGGSTSATGATGATTTVGSGGGASTSTGATGTGGAAGCDMKVTCAVAITDGTGDKICDGTTSATLYDAYFACTCKVGGPCESACGATYCKGMTSTTECTACLQDNSAKGCKVQVDACASDV